MFFQAITIQSLTIWLTIVICITMMTLPSNASSTSSVNYPSFSVRLPGNPYSTDWEEDDIDEESSKRKLGRWVSTGREYDIFDSRGGSSSSSSSESSNNSEQSDFMDRYLQSRERYLQSRYASNNRFFPRPIPGLRKKKPEIFQTVQDFWTKSISPKIDSLPKINVRVEPTTTLKLRKTFRPLKTIVRMGADFNTQLGVWQFKSSWEEPLIGGKLTLIGNELHLTKSWQLSVGAVEDLVTRLRFRAAINLQTFQAYARVGFRTERLSPINVMEGFTILKRLPLDGSGGNVKLEVKANVALPEPEIEYSTESQRSLIGMGDVEVSIDEMNLLLDY